MHADNTTAFAVGDSVDEDVQKLREASSQMNNWCPQNKLTVNAKKSKAMLITTKKFSGPLLPVQMGGKYLDFKTSKKVLGVTIDNRMSWKVHSDKVAKSISSKVCMLIRLKYLPSQVLEDIYYKTIIPAAIFCISVWGNCSKTTLSKIERKHIRGAKIIYRLPRHVENEHVLAAAKWQSNSYIQHRRVAIEMHKVIFDEKSRISMQYHQRRKVGRNGEHFEITRVRTEVGRHSLGYRGPVVWNALSTNLKEERNLKTFKRRLKSNLKTLKLVNFAKGTTFNRNKDIVNYVYY